MFIKHQFVVFNLEWFFDSNYSLLAPHKIRGIQAKLRRIFYSRGLRRIGKTTLNIDRVALRIGQHSALRG